MASNRLRTGRELALQARDARGVAETWRRVGMSTFRFILQLVVVAWFSLIAGMVCAAELLR
jgi:hypothetical protein